MNKEEQVKEENEIAVVENLPQVYQREIVEDNKKYTLLTKEEALTEILRIVKNIERSVA